MESTPLIQPSAKQNTQHTNPLLLANAFIQHQHNNPQPTQVQPVLYAFIQKPTRQKRWSQKALTLTFVALLLFISYYYYSHHDKHYHHPIEIDPTDPRLPMLFPIGDKTQLSKRLSTPKEWLNFKCVGFALLEINTFQDKTLHRPKIEYQLFANDVDARRYVEWSFESTKANLTISLKSTESRPTNPHIKFQVNVTLPDIEGNPFSINGHGSVLRLNWFPDTFHKKVLIHSSVGSHVFRNIQARYSNFDSSAGSIKMTNVVFSDALIESKSGSIQIENGSIAEAKIKSSAGSIAIINGNISNAIIESRSGSVKIDSGMFKTANIDSNAGSIHITNGNISDVVLKANAGSVKIRNGTISDVTIEVNAGSIQAAIAGLKSLQSVSSAGSIHLELYTLSNPQISVSANAGSIQSSIHGFQGNYLVESQFGSCSVSKEVSIQRNIKCSREGVLGRGYGNYTAKSHLGSNHVKFY